MQSFKLVSAMALMVVLATVSATTASASLLPGTAKTTIKGIGGKSTFQVKGGTAFTCKESKATGEVVSATESLILLTLGTNCTAGGLPFKSAGDASGTILIHAEVLDCAIAGGRALVFLFLPVKLEVPATKLTIELKGSMLAPVSPVNKKAKSFTLTIQQKEGKALVESCEGGEKHVLETSTDGGGFVSSAFESSEFKLEYSAEQEFMA